MQTALDSMQLGSFANGLTATTIKFKAFGAGAKIASAGLQVFKALIEGLSSPLGMATIGIATAGGALLNFLHQKIKPKETNKLRHIQILNKRHLLIPLPLMRHMLLINKLAK